MTIADAAWWLDNVSLNTAGYWVRSLGFDEDTPARRGENLISPGVSGRRHVDKVFDQKVMPLLLVVDAISPVFGGARSGAQLATNLATIKALFSKDGTHELKRTHGGATRVATVEVRQLRMAAAGPYHYNVAAELVFADPFWYASSNTVVSKTFTGTLPDTLAVTNNGSYKAEKVAIRIRGPITNPRLTFGNTWVQYTGSVTTPSDYLDIDTAAFTAMLDLVSADPVSVLADITWADGLTRWLEVPTGTNNVTLSGTKGAGNPVLTLTFKDTYL